MANINITSPGDTDIISQYPADERASRAAILDLLSGTAVWGGTSGGSATNQTLTVSNSGLALTSGLSIVFIAGFTRVGSVNFQVNALANLGARDPDGNTFTKTTTVAGRVHQIVYAGGVWRLMNPAGWMSQQEYDIRHPVGDTVLRRVTTAPEVPDGVTATWTRTTTESFLRVESGTPTTAGSASFNTGSTTLSESQIPSHTHQLVGAGEFDAGALGSSDAIAEQASLGGFDSYTLKGDSSTPTLGRSSATGGGGGHTHTVASANILARTYAVWERTA